VPPKRKPSSPLLTVPELAKALGVSDQTVRRWVRTQRIPSTRNPEGWPLVHLEDVPADLLEATKKLSGRRYPKPQAEPSEADRAEIAYLRTQLEQALSIIKLLSSDEAHDG
jgi:excisionase family DNA binding protein